MPNCPVKSSPEWVALESALGKTDAYKAFVAWEGNIPPMVEVEEFITLVAPLYAEAKDDTPIKYTKEKTAEEMLLEIASNPGGNVSARHVRLAHRLLPLIHDEVKVGILPRSEMHKMFVTEEEALARGITTGAFTPEARYNPGDKTIDIAYNEKGTLDLEIVLHEIIHSLTWEQLRQETDSKRELQELFDAYEAVAPKLYTYSNLDEFIVGTFTDLKLIKFLKEQPATTDRKFTNLWEEFLDILTRMFNKGLKKNPQISRSALAQAMDIGATMMQANREQEEGSAELEARTESIPPGEPPLADLFVAAPGKKSLKKELGLHRKEISYQQVINSLSRLKKYNKANGTNHSIKFEQVGQANLYTYVVKEDTQGKLFQMSNEQKQAANEELNNKLKALLTELGVRVEAVDSLIEHTGYDAISVADILEKTILVAKGKEDISTLPEEFAHFFMEALGDEHPLMKLMLKAVDERYIAILGRDYEKYFNAYGGNITKLKKEAAGKLFGEVLITKHEASDDIALVRLLKKIRNKVLSFFRSVEENTFRKEVEKVYGTTATSVLDGDISGATKAALAESKEDQFFNIGNKSLNTMQKALQGALQAINKKMRIYRGRGEEDFVGADKKLYYELLRKFENKAETLGVVQFLQNMQKEFKAIEKEMIAAEELMSSDEMYSMSHITKKLREMKTYALAYKPILEMLTQELKGDKYITEDPANIEDIKLGKTDLSKIGSINKGLYEFSSKMLKDLNEIEASYHQMGVPIFAEFLKPFAGDQYDERKLTDAIRFAERDISFFERWLDSMAESSDDILKLVDEAVSDTKEGARLKAIEDQKVLHEALAALEASGIKDTDWIAEQLNDGSLSGNFITKYNWGDFVNAKNEFFDKMRRKYGLPVNPNSGRTIPFDFLADGEVLDWYESAKHLPIVMETQEALESKNNYSTDEQMIYALKDALDTVYGKDVAIWYKENAKPRDDVAEIMQRKSDELTKEQFNAWLKKNRWWSKYHNTNMYRSELSQPSDKYINKQFANLNEAQVEFHGIVMDMKAKLDALMPGKFQREFLMPQIRKDFVERLKDIKSPKDLKELKKEFGEAFRVQEDEEERGARLEEQKIITDEEGNAISFLPVMYVRPIKDMKSLSTDIVSSLSMYSAMVHDYHAMNKIIDVLELGKDVLSKRDVGEQTGSGGKVGEVLNSAAQRMQGFVSKNPKSTKHSYARLQDYYDMIVYGQLKKNEGTFKIPILGIEMDTAKAIDMFGRFVSIHGLAFNVFAGLQNPILGNMLIREEAIAGAYYDNTDLLWADKTYASELPGVLAEVGVRNQTNKMSLWAEKADTLQSYSSDLREIDTKRKTRFGKLFNLSALFVVNHIGEHQMQLRSSLAMAHKFKLKDANGKEINLYDAHEVVGNKLVLKEGLTFPDGTPFTERDFIKFVRRQNFINKRLHGIYNQRDRAAMQKYAVGRLAIMVRKWLKPGFNRRFQSTRYNFEGDTTTEGFYKTTGNFLGKLVKDLQKGKFLAVAHWGELKDYEKQNLIRMLTETTYLLGAIVLAHILTNFANDDDENFALNMMAYQVNRLVTEVGIYVPLFGTREAMRIFKTPAAAVNTIDSLVSLMKFWEWGEVYSRGYYEGRTKFYKRSTGMIPVYHQIEGLMHTDDKLIFFVGE